jgi:hypothetical protein
MKGKKRGIRITRRITTISCKSQPAFTKSIKEYRPGPSTKVLGGVATGVKKHAEVAKPTPISSGAGLQPNNTPTSRAIGANNAAVAVLDIKFVTITLTMMRAIKTA